MSKVEKLFAGIIVLCGAVIAIFIALSLKNEMPTDEAGGVKDKTVRNINDNKILPNITHKPPEDKDLGEITGMVVDSNNVPVTEALVQCFYFDSGVARDGNSSWTKEGHFKIKGLVPAVYSVRASKQGYGSKQMDQIDITKLTKHNLQKPIVLQQTQGLEIIVTTGEGLQIQAAKITVFARVQTGSVQMFYKKIREETTDISGKILLKDLSDGGYDFSVSKEGYSTVHESIVIRDGKVANLNWRGNIVLNPMRK